jgi:hypothetical protein
MLLVICDFLLLSLLALARFDPAVSQNPEEAEGDRAPLSPEAELVEILKLSLDSERLSQQALQEELEREQRAREERERSLAQTTEQLSQTEQRLRQEQEDLRREQQQREELMSQRQMLQQEKGELASDLIRMRELSILERERLRQAQLQIEQQQQSLQETLQTVAAIDEAKKKLEQEKQLVLTELKVAETRQVLIEQQLENSRLEIEFERRQREEAQKRAESLTEGVKVLAGTSVEIKEEIRQLQPKTPNALFTEYKRNRVRVKFETTFPGIFKNRNRTWEVPTILVSDTRRTYAILHTEDSPFDLAAALPRYERVDLSITIGGTVITPERIEFLRIDPRIFVIPIDGDVAAIEGVKVYPIVLEPFRFPKAVVIDNAENYFGESSFRVHPEFSYALQMDRRILSQLSGEFNPSRGDLVLAQTGEFMGVMVNNDYAALLDHIAVSDTLWMGPTFDAERTITILTKLSSLVYRTR